MTKVKRAAIIHTFTLYVFSGLIIVCGTTTPAFSCLSLQETVSVFEGKDAVFKFKRCHHYASFRYKYTTANGSAVSPSDYKKQTGTLNFWYSFLHQQQQGDTKVTVKTYDEGVCEANEKFYLKLSNLEVYQNPYEGWKAYENGGEGLPGGFTFSANIRQWHGTTLNQGSGQYWSTSHSGCGSSGTFGE